jgi:hypothetical protein
MVAHISANVAEFGSTFRAGSSFGNENQASRRCRCCSKCLITKCFENAFLWLEVDNAMVEDSAAFVPEAMLQDIRLDLAVWHSRDSYFLGT